MTGSSNKASRFFANVGNKIAGWFRNFGRSFVGFFRKIPTNLKKFGRKIADGFVRFGRNFAEGDAGVRCSYFIMGSGAFAHGQIVKGLGYLAIELLFILYMAFNGVGSLAGLVTL